MDQEQSGEILKKDQIFLDIKHRSREGAYGGDRGEQLPAEA
jgi:hypothetical protein